MTTTPKTTKMPLKSEAQLDFLSDPFKFLSNFSSDPMKFLSTLPDPFKLFSFLPNGTADGKKVSKREAPINLPDPETMDPSKLLSALPADPAQLLSALATAGSDAVPPPTDAKNVSKREAPLYMPDSDKLNPVKLPSSRPAAPPSDAMPDPSTEAKTQRQPLKSEAQLDFLSDPLAALADVSMDPSTMLTNFSLDPSKLMPSVGGDKNVTKREATVNMSIDAAQLLTDLEIDPKSIIDGAISQATDQFSPTTIAKKMTDGFGSFTDLFRQRRRAEEQARRYPSRKVQKSADRDVDLEPCSSETTTCVTKALPPPATTMRNGGGGRLRRRLERRRSTWIPVSSEESHEGRQAYDRLVYGTRHRNARKQIDDEDSYEEELGRQREPPRRRTRPRKPFKDEYDTVDRYSDETDRRRGRTKPRGKHLYDDEDDSEQHDDGYYSDETFDRRVSSRRPKPKPKSSKGRPRQEDVDDSADYDHEYVVSDGPTTNAPHITDPDVALYQAHLERAKAIAAAKAWDAQVEAVMAHKRKMAGHGGIDGVDGVDGVDAATQKPCEPPGCELRVQVIPYYATMPLRGEVIYDGTKDQPYVGSDTTIMRRPGYEYYPQPQLGSPDEHPMYEQHDYPMMAGHDPMVAAHNPTMSAPPVPDPAAHNQTMSAPVPDPQALTAPAESESETAAAVTTTELPADDASTTNAAAASTDATTEAATTQAAPMTEEGSTEAPATTTTVAATQDTTT